MSETPDIVIIGSGIGGATVAAGLAASGARILILEAGDHCPIGRRTAIRAPSSSAAISGRRKPGYERDGTGFNPGNYYNVGGNSKFFGAVMLRYRREDFAELAHLEGVSPAWPFPYEELEPWYSRAEHTCITCAGGRARIRANRRIRRLCLSSIPDEPPIADVRARLKAQGLHPFSLPLAVDIDRWLAKAKTPWDAHPNSNDGKMDAEASALSIALRHPNVSLKTRARVLRLEAGDNGAIERIHYEHDAQPPSCPPSSSFWPQAPCNRRCFSCVRPTGRRPRGLANGSTPGRPEFHETTTRPPSLPSRRATATPRSIRRPSASTNSTFSDGEGGPPLGNVQLLGRISAPVLKGTLPKIPEWALAQITDRAIDFYAMSEDIPHPESRIMVRGRADRAAMAPDQLGCASPARFQAQGRAQGSRLPARALRPFDKRTPSHQCGTVRMGTDPATAPLDTFCRAFEHPTFSSSMRASCRPRPP